MKRGLLLIGMLALLVISLGFLFQFPAPSSQAQTVPPTVPPTKPPTVPPTVPPVEAQPAGEDKDNNGVGVGVGLAMDVQQIEPRLQPARFDSDPGSPDTDPFAPGVLHAYPIKFVCGEKTEEDYNNGRTEVKPANYATVINFAFLPVILPGGEDDPLFNNRVDIRFFGAGILLSPESKEDLIARIQFFVLTSTGGVEDTERHVLPICDYLRGLPDDELQLDPKGFFEGTLVIYLPALPMVGRTELAQIVEVTAVYTALHKQVHTGKDDK